MKIIIIQSVAGFGPEGQAGGGEIHLHRIANEWKKKGGTEIILLTNQNDFGSLAYEAYDRVIFLPSLHLGPFRGSNTMRMYFQWLFQIKLINRYAVIFGTDEPTILIGSSPAFSDVILLHYLMKKLRHKGVVYFHHIPPSPLFYTSKRGGVLPSFLNWFNSNLSLLLSKIGGSIPILDQPSTLNTTAWKFHRPIIKDEDFIEVQDQIGHLPREKLLLCFISRKDANKGMLDIPFILKNVKREIPDVKMIIAGPTTEYSTQRKFDKIIAEFGLDNCIHQLDYISKEEKYKILKKATLFIFPSYVEGWSLSVMEAAYHGCVPVTYALPAYDYLGPDAVRVPIGDIGGMAKKIIFFLENPEERENIAKNLSRQVRNYNPIEIANYQLEAFSKISNHR